MDENECKCVKKKILSKKDLRLHSEFTRLNYILNHTLIILNNKTKK